MQERNKDILILFLIGVIIGIFVMAIGGVFLYKVVKRTRQPARYAEKREVVKNEEKPAPSPVLKEFFLSFEDEEELGIFQSEGVSLEMSRKNTTHGKQSLLAKFEPGTRYPGLIWEVYGGKVLNWSQIKDFHFDVYNDNEDDITLEVKFKSGRDYPKKPYSEFVHLEPMAMNHVKIPIENITQSCDLAQMSYLKIFIKSPEEDYTLFFDNMGTREPNANDKIASEESEVGPSAVFPPPGPGMVLKEGFDLFVATSLDRIFQDGKTLLKPSFTQVASLSLAKNEYESFQIVVNNGRNELKSVELILSDLIDETTDQRIDKQNITWRVVGYVPTKKPYYPVKFVGMWPDPLLPVKKTDIPPGLTQPFWVTVYIPKTTIAGNYAGTIQLTAEGVEPRSIPVSVRVYDFTLPQEGLLKTAFDFYGHETRTRYKQHPQETEEEYKVRIAELNEKFILEMLKYRINPILNIDPTSSEDLARIERYRALGLTNFSIGRKGGTFSNNWPKDKEGIEKLIPLYRSYAEILKDNNLFKYHYIYTWDEGKLGNPQVAKICSMIHKAHPELKNMVCYHGFWDPQKDPEWGKDINIWTFQIDAFNEKKMRQLQDKGIEIWMYASGPSGYGTPNLIIDTDSIDYRIIPWLCWKYDIEGFLYWSVNWWVRVNPFKSAVNTEWEQNGNGLLFYPGETGPVASLRLEIFRDGMEDYEYIRLLRRKINVVENQGLGYEDLVKQGYALLTVDPSLATSMRNFTKDNEVLFARRNSIAKLIEEFDKISRNPKVSLPVASVQSVQNLER